MAAAASGTSKLSNDSLLGPGGLVVGGPTKEGQGVVYLSHLPHGFYEDQMKGFFGQFGTVTRLRLARSKKSGRSKGYAYVEFASKAVADIVATTMHGYYLKDKYVRARSLSADQVHPRLFVGAHRKFKWIPWRLNEKKRRDKEVSADTLSKRVRKLLKGEMKLREALREKSIDYSFGGYSEAVVRAILRREELLASGALSESADGEAQGADDSRAEAADEEKASSSSSSGAGLSTRASSAAASSEPSSAGAGDAEEKEADGDDEDYDEGEDSEGSEGEVDLDDEEAMLKRLERITGSGPDSGGVVLEAEVGSADDAELEQGAGGDAGTAGSSATPARRSRGGKKGSSSGKKAGAKASAKKSNGEKLAQDRSKTPTGTRPGGKRRRDSGAGAQARTPQQNGGSKGTGSSSRKQAPGSKAKGGKKRRVD